VKYFKCIALFVSLVFLSSLNLFQETVRAEELDGEFEISTGGDTSRFSDDTYSSYVSLDTGDYVTVSSEKEFTGIYIIWNKPVAEWELVTDNETIIAGKNGFLHEYVEIAGGTKEAKINIKSDGMQISEIRIFDGTTLPKDVQVWQPPCENADFLLFSSHADDEILFFGGIIPTYVQNGARIEVCYMTQYWDTTSVREHEKLDGLWTIGIKNYPVSAKFTDLYSESLEAAQKQYNTDDLTEFVVEQIRRFKPLIVVTHDIKGEYGHGFHQITSLAVRNAVECSMDNSYFVDSANKYGVWDVKKTYIHLYEQNPIVLNLRVPIESMEGKTALELANLAYKQHVSQQWCWFYVDDEYEYSCAKFGLYRTTVGVDVNNDMTENVELYAVAEEKERLRLEEESRSIEASQKEASSIAERESIKASEKESLELEKEKKEKKEKKNKKVIGVILLIVIVVAFVVGVLIYLHNMNNRKRRRRRKLRMKKM